MNENTLDLKKDKQKIEKDFSIFFEKVEKSKVESSLVRRC